MVANIIQARHVFHPATSGWDRVHAWQEATAEPVFVWGRNSGASDGLFFQSVKRDYRKWLEATSSAPITVYHDGVGVDALGPLDPNAHKVLYQHCWFPRWERNFEWTIRCTGKVLVGHESFIGNIRQKYGWIPERFIQSSKEPDLKMTGTGNEGTGAKARTGIWLHGRPWRRSGNRLRAIVDRWPAEAGQLEIVVSGAGRPGWSKKDHVVWSANRPMEFALHRLHTWDSTLLLNDYALDSPWLKIAMGMDCFPMIPDGEAPTRTPEWLADSAPQTYPWGDTPAAVKLLKGWRTEREDLLGNFREWVQGLDGISRGDADFTSSWAQAKSNILDQRSPQLRSRRALGGWQPVAWYERIQRLRAGY